MMPARFGMRAGAALTGISMVGLGWFILGTTQRDGRAFGGAAPPHAAQTDASVSDPLVGPSLEQLSSRAPDAMHGAQIAAQGLGPNVPACAQCHAYNGGSDGSGAFPRIAGQSTFYLFKQLVAFASGERNNAVMSPIAKALKPNDAADVAAYYAGASAPLLPLADVNPALFKRGQLLATIGDEMKDVQACTNCHGPGGAGGQPPAIPYLAGQYAPYIAFELRMWQRGFRKTSPDAMGHIVKNLDGSDVDALAAYFQQAFAAPAEPGKATE
jgi:cytochrome c553